MGHETYRKEEVLDLIEREWIEFVEGTAWKCIRCGQCCKTNWRINLTWIEFERLRNDPRDLDLPRFQIQVQPETGADHPYFVIDEMCPLLIQKGNICTAHPDWPYTCATYPFLLMPDGRFLVHTGCKGIGKGEKVDIDRMKVNILKERKKAGMIVP